MAFYPAFLNLNGKLALVFGGGAVAERKIQSLLACGAVVVVVSPEVTAGIEALARAGVVELWQREYRAGDCGGAFAVIAATDDESVQEQIWEEAQELRCLINTVDAPKRCNFIVPAVVERGDLTIAISTSGRSPALAARLRRAIECLIGPEYGQLLDLMARFRPEIRRDIPDFERRREFYSRILDEIVPDNLQSLDLTAAEQRLRHELEQASPEVHTTKSETRSPQGDVYLVGAGPGDPELITVKALRYLRTADVVLYDRLIPVELLAETRWDAQLINVGKERGREDLQQDLIQEMMVDFARQGKSVCRLKGGDPFVFGRGGEEAEALIKAGISFEVVPGITSAIAAPAAAGVPVTHRDHNHGFMVIAGNRSHRFDSPEWVCARRLLQAGGTLVVLMGLGRISDITEYLQTGGCAGSVPAAVICNATREDQQARFGTIENIASLARNLPSPAVFVIGSVVAACLVPELVYSASSGEGPNRGFE
jgi:uroporphyrin-III C-methyltransferase/precorrin-2 dehydrogenase/sirohydrochlorin ferrochelatase